MKALVTGGCGFVASHLVDRLLEEGWGVHVVDDLSTGLRENVPESVEVISGLSIAKLPEADWIFHLAAVVGVERVAQFPGKTLADAELTKHAARCAIHANAKLFYASSSETYDLQPSPDLRYAYPCSKLMGELHVLASGVPHIIGRLFNTVGPRQRPDFGMVLPRFVEAALSDGPLTIFGSGHQTRTFCHVQDTVGAILKLVKADAEGTFDIGSPQEISIIGLAQTVIKVIGKGYIVHDKPRHHDVNRRRPDLTPLHNVTPWLPTISLEETIEECASSF
jgi:UDP-glucose 4-epimerase